MLFHVDEVDHDQPGEVAQPELPGNFFGCFEIGAERGLLDVALACRASRIDVDRNQRFRLIYHDIAAGAELDDRRMDRVDLVFDLKTVK